VSPRRMATPQAISCLPPSRRRRMATRHGTIGPSEKEWLEQVRKLAVEFYGWELYHPWLSIRSARGWPDIALVRPPRLILAELKTDKGKLRPSQERWLALLGQCPGVEVYVWRPSDLEHVRDVLQR
jgi:hypothetical protein